MKIRIVNIDTIKPYEKNPRKNDIAVDKVAASLTEFGFKQPIVVDKNGVIIAGHTRHKAALKLGIKEVPVLYAEDLTTEQVQAYRLADNKTAEFAEWDTSLLGEELSGLADVGFDMQPFGFERDIEPEEDDFDVSGVVDSITEPITMPGDVWLLGRHRLVCGDATALSDVEKLTDGKMADMIFTDPPYNVDYEGATKEKLRIQNDKMSNDNFYQFLYDSFVNMFAVTVNGGGIYICHADSEGINFRTAMAEAGWLCKQCIIWAKNSIVMGRQDYHWKHEPILYGWKPGAAHNWNGGRKQSTVIEDGEIVTVKPCNDGHIITFVNGLSILSIKVPSYEVEYSGDDSLTTVWRVEKPLRNAEHPTMKPITLVVRAIKNSSKQGCIVLDLFGGSGSTLIAAEQLNRICYIMELDPKYCDVIVQRWENLTGQKAELVKVGNANERPQAIPVYGDGNDKR